MTQQILLVTKEDLIEAFREVQKTDQPSKPVNVQAEKMTRTEASKFLDVHLQTMHNWTKSGILTEHGHGRKKFYLKQELIEAMRNKKSPEHQ
ncbi:MAG: helix-turn-helix domain-containing protein [Bacteroidetes bacterium]|nr:helix-turn-helix domain-containing protein [Bacteroidota bacterium]